MDKLQEIINEVQSYYEAQDPGHDWAHIKRVMKLGEMLALEEKAQPIIVEHACLLHDIVNIPKNHPERHMASEHASKKAYKLLMGKGYSEEFSHKVEKAILEHSFSKGLKVTSLESACLQDADRLDAIGAIGIIRCVSTGTTMGGQFYQAHDPWAQNRELDDKAYMLDHFKKKLFKLPDLLNTKTAKKIAQARLEFMRSFLDQLKTEIG
jgi:uncharacterized protein